MRKGSALIAAIMLIPIFGFAALSIDIGQQRVINMQMQTSFDSATLSGTKMLNGTLEGVQNAIDETYSIARTNTIYHNYEPSIENITLGRYEEGVFNELALDDYEIINAIKLEGVHTYPSIIAGPAFGKSFLNSYSLSIAAKPPAGAAKYVDCYMPLVIPSCHFLNMQTGTNPDPLSLDLSNTNTLGWGMPIVNPNTTIIKNQIGFECSNGTAAVYDEDDGDTVYNNINIANGQNNSAVDYIAEVLNNMAEDAVPSPWPYDYFGNPYPRNGYQANLAADSDIHGGSWGNTIGGVVPIIDHNCGDELVGSARILGWTYAYIYDTKTTGSGGKNIWIQFDFVNDYEVGYYYDVGGMGNIEGTTPPILVK